MPILPVTPVRPGAPDNLLEALRGASIVDEHRVLMGTVIERVQSAKSGLTKACSILLTSFEVSDAKRENPHIDSSPRDTVRRSEIKCRTEDQSFIAGN